MGGACQQCGDMTNQLRAVDFPAHDPEGRRTGDIETAWLCRACERIAEDRYEGDINRWNSARCGGREHVFADHNGRCVCGILSLSDLRRVKPGDHVV